MEVVINKDGLTAPVPNGIGQKEAAKEVFSDVILNASSIREKFVFQRLIHEAKSAGLDSAAGRRTVEELLRGRKPMGVASPAEVDGKGEVEAVIRDGKPHTVVTTANPQEFVDDKRTIEIERGKKDTDYTKISRILRKIYYGEPYPPSPEVRLLGPKEDTAGRVVIRLKDSTISVEGLPSGLGAVMPLAGASAVGAESKDRVSVVRFKPGVAREFLNEDELMFFTGWARNMLEARGLIPEKGAKKPEGKAPTRKPGKSQEQLRPAGLDELIGLINEIEANPMLRRDKEAKGLTQVELGVVDRHIGLLDEDKRLQCWVALDYMSPSGRENVVKRLARIGISNMPAADKKEAVVDVFGRSIRFDAQREMLSWIDDGLVMTIDQKPELRQMNKGLKTIGLLGAGEKAESVEEVSSGKNRRWSIRTNRNKAWLLAYDKVRGRVAFYEGAEGPKNLRATVLADIDAHNASTFHLYDEKMPAEFMRKYCAVGGLFWSKVGLPKEQLEKAKEIVDKVGGDHKITFLKVVSRMSLRSNDDRAGLIENILEKARAYEKDPAKMCVELTGSLHINLARLMINSTVFEMDCIRQAEKPAFIDGIFRLVEDTSEGLDKRRNRFANAYAICDRADAVEVLHSTPTYILAKETLAAMTAKKPTADFLNFMFLTSINADFMRMSFEALAKADDVSDHAQYLHEKSAQTISVLDDIRTDAKFREYYEPLKRGDAHIPNVDDADMDGLRGAVRLFDAAASDTDYIAKFTGPLARMAKESPEAAIEYAARYTPRTAAGWDGTVVQYEGLAESAGKVARIADDDAYRSLFIQRLERVKKIRDFDNTNVKGIKDRSLAEAISLTMANGPNQMEFLTRSGVLEAAEYCADLKPDRDYLLREFLACLGDNPQLNVAKAYTILFRVDDMQSMNDARAFLRRSVLNDDDLKSISAEQWKEMEGEPKKILAAFRGLETKKREYQNALVELPAGMKSEYEKLAERIPKLKDAESARKLAAITSGHTPEVQAAVLALIGDVSTTADPAETQTAMDRAAGMLDSKALVRRLGEMLYAPYSAGRFTALLRGKVDRFRMREPEAVVESAFKDRTFQLEYAIEQGTGDWSSHEGDRGRTIQMIAEAPEGYRPYVMAIGAGRLQREITSNPNYLNDLYMYLYQNPDVTALAGPLCVRAENDGRLEVLRGAKIT
ncbi:MAG: hypothetical protein PHG85_00895 [Candidatus Altiarchaeota archaeon]|nr:hypothetical protein [Candidatus Altiarchaeota archaeon]